MPWIFRDTDGFGVMTVMWDKRFAALFSPGLVFLNKTSIVQLLGFEVGWWIPELSQFPTLGYLVLEHPRAVLHATRPFSSCIYLDTHPILRSSQPSQASQDGSS